MQTNYKLGFSRVKTSFKMTISKYLLVLVALLVDLQVAIASAAEKAQTPGVTQIKQAPVSGESVFGVVLSLVLVIAVIFIMAWIMRRMNGLGPRSNALMKVLGGLSMGSRERVVLIQVGDEQLLLGVAPGRIQTLHVLDKPVDVASLTDVQADSFSERLKSVLNKEK